MKASRTGVFMFWWTYKKTNAEKGKKNQDYKKRLKDSCPRVSTDVMQIVVSGLSKVRRNPVVIVKLSRMRLRSVICAILISSEDLSFKGKKPTFSNQFDKLKGL